MHLGSFAHLLHITPRQVDDLRLKDFCQLVMWVESYIEAHKNPPQNG
jgi:hypothetical protein